MKEWTENMKDWYVRLTKEYRMSHKRSCVIVNWLHKIRTTIEGMPYQLLTREDFERIVAEIREENPDSNISGLIWYRLVMKMSKRLNLSHQDKETLRKLR